MKTLAAAFAALLIAVTTAAAQIQIDKQRPASRTAQVSIDNMSGSVTVIGWSRNEVAVKGWLAPAAEGLEFGGDEESISIRVEIPDSRSHGRHDASQYETDLEVHVPVGSSVDVETVSATIRAEGLEGALQIETVSGGITVAGRPRTLGVRCVSGTVRADVDGTEIEIELVSGNIDVRGAARVLSVTSISGGVRISGRDFERVRVGSVSGDIRFEGSFRPEGRMEVEMHSGDVSLFLPRDVAARFRLTTFSGDIESDLGPRPSRRSEYGPGMESRFTVGRSDFEVEVETFSGNINVRVDGDRSPGGSKRPSGGD